MQGQQGEQPTLVGRQFAVGELERGEHAAFAVVEFAQQIGWFGEPVAQIRE